MGSSEKYTYCVKCFEAIPGEQVNLGDEAEPNWVSRQKFQFLKNDHLDYEEFVNCTKCGRKWHQICALHINNIHNEFVCRPCRKEKALPLPENKYTAKRLPVCKLTEFLEGRVNGFLRKEGVLKGDGEGEVIIRVLSSSDKEAEVRPLMRAKFCESGELPEKFPYRAKAIFAFEVINGVEVCFFGLHVQEYGSNCPQPNNRRVYIAYLDSVYYFQPKEYRTHVYHEILLAYLEYVKQLGYTMAHIWACPPSEGDDYIFHCHPPEQKIPKPKRLQDWYKKMLDRGIHEKIVVDYKDMYKQAQDDNVKCISQIPYFEGDFWPNQFEEQIKLVDDQAEAERAAQLAQMGFDGSGNSQGDGDVDDGMDDGSNGSGKKKQGNKVNKKKSQKAKSGVVKKSKKSGGGITGNDLTDRIYVSMEKNREVFFTVHLIRKEQQQALGPISDPDKLVSCELMDGRDNFLQTARDKHWEFSSLRRAQFSTLAMCYELNTQNDGVAYKCNGCEKQNASLHCTVCEDYDLCQECYERLKHPHKMEDLRVMEMSKDHRVDDDRQTSIQRCIASLVHACKCKESNCTRVSCHKMRRVVTHAKQCTRRQTGECPVCRQLIALCCYHAKHCLDVSCLVPFCTNIRQRLHEQQQLQKKKREREMNRRMQLQGYAVSGNQPQIPAAGPAPLGPGVASQPVMPPGSAPSGHPVHVTLNTASAMQGHGGIPQGILHHQQQQQQRAIYQQQQQQGQFGNPQVIGMQQRQVPPNMTDQNSAAARTAMEIEAMAHNQISSYPPRGVSPNVAGANVNMGRGRMPMQMRPQGGQQQMNPQWVAMQQQGIRPGPGQYVMSRGPIGASPQQIAAMQQQQQQQSQMMMEGDGVVQQNMGNMQPQGQQSNDMTSFVQEIRNCHPSRARQLVQDNIVHANRLLATNSQAKVQPRAYMNSQMPRGPGMMQGQPGGYTRFPQPSPQQQVPYPAQAGPGQLQRAGSQAEMYRAYQAGGIPQSPRGAPQNAGGQAMSPHGGGMYLRSPSQGPPSVNPMTPSPHPTSSPHPGMLATQQQQGPPADLLDQNFNN